MVGCASAAQSGPSNSSDVSVRLADLGANESGGAGAVRVLPVAGALFGVGAHERVQDRGRGALGIIVAELVHGMAPNRRDSSYWSGCYCTVWSGSDVR